MANEFVGIWRIVATELWYSEAIDLLGPAFLSLAGDGSGEFRFIAVEGFVDWKAEQDPGSRVHFSWEGSDEGQPVSGRGWMTMENDETLAGRISFHSDDDSAFRAVAMHA